LVDGDCLSWAVAFAATTLAAAFAFATSLASTLPPLSTFASEPFVRLAAVGGDMALFTTVVASSGDVPDEWRFFDLSNLLLLTEVLGITYSNAEACQRFKFRDSGNELACVASDPSRKNGDLQCHNDVTTFSSE
jgi:hypothetical protein